MHGANPLPRRGQHRADVDADQDREWLSRSCTAVPPFVGVNGSSTSGARSQLLPRKVEADRSFISILVPTHSRALHTATDSGCDQRLARNPHGGIP